MKVNLWSHCYTKSKRFQLILFISDFILKVFWFYPHCFVKSYGFVYLFWRQSNALLRRPGFFQNTKIIRYHCLYFGDTIWDSVKLVGYLLVLVWLCKYLEHQLCRRVLWIQLLSTHASVYKLLCFSGLAHYFFDFSKSALYLFSIFLHKFGLNKHIKVIEPIFWVNFFAQDWINVTLLCLKSIFLNFTAISSLEIIHDGI